MDEPDDDAVVTGGDSMAQNASRQDQNQAQSIATMGPVLLSVRLQPDAYYIFLVVVFGALAVMTIGMAAIAWWLFRRNRRLPRLVKGRRIR